MEENLEKVPETEAISTENTKKKKKKLTKVEKWFRTLRRFYYYGIMRFIFKYKRYGYTEKLNDRSYIVVGNHLYKMDVIPAAMATDKVVHYMAKSELFEKGFSKWLTNKSECIPVKRDGSDVRAIMQAMKYLKAGEFVCCFPEGTRNKTDDLFLPFKGGAAAIAIKTKTPVLPMVQLKGFDKKRKPILYGKPFELTEYYDKKLTPEVMAEAEEIIRKKLEDMYYELEEIVENDPKMRKKRNKKYRK